MLIISGSRRVQTGPDQVPGEAYLNRPGPGRGPSRGGSYQLARAHSVLHCMEFWRSRGGNRDRRNCGAGLERRRPARTRIWKARIEAKRKTRQDSVIQFLLGEAQQWRQKHAVPGLLVVGFAAETALAPSKRAGGGRRPEGSENTVQEANETPVRDVKCEDFPQLHPRGARSVATGTHTTSK